MIDDLIGRKAALMLQYISAIDIDKVEAWRPAALNQKVRYGDQH